MENEVFIKVIVLEALCCDESSPALLIPAKELDGIVDMLQTKLGQRRKIMPPKPRAKNQGTYTIM